MATVVKVFRDAKAADNAAKTADPQGKQPKRLTKQETWSVLFDGVAEFSDVFGVVDPTTGEALPKEGYVYDGLFCSQVRPTRRTDTPYGWRVTVDFESIVVQSEGTNGSNVWNLNLRKSSAVRQETVTRDRLDLPLVNAFGELLPQLPTDDLYDEVWTFTWSTSVAPSEDILGKLNSDSVSWNICGIARSYSPSQLKVIADDFDVTKVITSTDGDTRQRLFIYNRTLTLHARKPKWVWRAPNEGWRGQIGSPFGGASKVDTFREADGITPRSAPTKMDRQGFALDPTSTILMIPDDFIGQSVPNSGRAWEDGAFELPKRAALSPLISTLVDADDDLSETT